MLDKQLRYHNVLPRCPLPPCAAAFHPHFKQALASSFRVATAERQAKSACPGVVHPIGVGAVSLEVGYSCVDRMVLANTLIETRPDQFLQNVGCCAAAIEQDHFPAAQPFTGHLGIAVYRMRRGGEL